DHIEEDASSFDPFALMHPPLIIGGPVMFPITGTFATAWAADQPAPASNVYEDSGPMPDGGHWEHYDDGYQWWYTEFDAAGNVTFHDSGKHDKSGGEGFQDARTTVQDGQEDTAPLNGLQGGRADTVVKPTADTDGDGTPDHLEEDMDGDGDPNVSDEDDDGNEVPDWRDEQEAQRKREKAAELTGRYQTIYNLASRVRKYRAEGNDAMAEAFQKDLNSHLNVVRDLEEELGRLPGAGDRIAYRTINGMGDE